MSRPDHRGHADTEGLARGAYSNPDYMVDVLNVVAALKVYDQADPDRIGMWEHSMGGFITLRSMLTDPDIRAGAVGSYPDLLERWRIGRPAHPTPRPSSWRNSLAVEFGTPSENPDFGDSISANSYVSELDAPIQLHHRAEDTRVPIEFSETLYAKIIETGGEVEYLA